MAIRDERYELPEDGPADGDTHVFGYTVMRNDMVLTDRIKPNQNVLSNQKDKAENDD